MDAKTRPWRSGLSIVSAALLILAHPPWSIGWLASLALVPLLTALRGQRLIARLGIGWLCGTVWSAGLVGVWLWPAAAAALERGPVVALLVAGAATQLYGGLHIAVFAALIGPGDGARGYRPSSIAALWVAVELLRSPIFAGIPWSLLGHALWSYPVFIQLAALGGVAALSFCLALVNAALAEAVDGWRRGRGGARPLALAAAVVALVAVHGWWRLANAPLAGDAASVAVQVVTGDWSQSDSEDTGDTLRRLSDLTAELAAGGASVAVWPEAALRSPPAERPRQAHRLYRLAAELRRDLLFGAPRAAAGHLYNSVYLLRPVTAEVVTWYDKRRLVPLAERRFTAGSDDLESARPDLASAHGPAVLTATGGLKIAPLLCFEALFADLAVAADADLFVNSTNDVAVGAGAAQQAAMAVFRAVENGIPLVRVANRGPSLLIDAYGRVLARAGGWGSHVWAVPPPISAPPFRRTGRWWSAVLPARAAGDGPLAWTCLAHALASGVAMARRTVVRPQG